jgi:uncharacterized protein
MVNKIPDKLTGDSFARFCEERNIRLAILFGSLAKGVAREDSDIDLAVLVDNSSLPEAILERGELKRKLVRDTISFLRASRVDVVLLNQASLLLRYQVARTGKVLYEKNPGDYAGFVSLSLRQHSDTRLFRYLDRKYLGQ